MMLFFDKTGCYESVGNGCVWSKSEVRLSR